MLIKCIIIIITIIIITDCCVFPTSYVIVASGLRPIHQHNRMMKYADDTYLMVGSRHISTAQEEFENISRWAELNNLKLNAIKTKELIVFRRRSSVAFDHPVPFIRGAERIATMRVLGMVVNSKITMKDRLDHLLSSRASSIHALRMLRVHGLQDKQIHLVASLTTLASMLYASPAWWGITTAQDRDRIEKMMSRLRRGGYLPPRHPSYEELVGEADEILKSIMTNPSHVLSKYLPKIKNTMVTILGPGHMGTSFHQRMI